MTSYRDKSIKRLISQTISYTFGARSAFAAHNYYVQVVFEGRIFNFPANSGLLKVAKGGQGLSPAAYLIHHVLWSLLTSCGNGLS